MSAADRLDHVVVACCGHQPLRGTPEPKRRQLGEGDVDALLHGTRRCHTAIAQRWTVAEAPSTLPFWSSAWTCTNGWVVSTHVAVSNEVFRN